MIALTFDDGPDPTWTPRVLDVLAAAGARATFFPLSPRMAEHPGLVARMHAEGHLVGLHGWDHLRHTDHDRATIEADTDRALAVFAEPPAWWRLPWGRAAPWSAEIAAARGLRIAGWTHDTHDWRGDAAEAMGDPPEGSIVLAHDALGPGATRVDCSETARFVERVLAAGRVAVRLDELRVAGPHDHRGG